LQQSLEVSHVAPAALQTSSPHVPSTHLFEQQSVALSQPTPGSRHPAMHISSTHTLPLQHAMFARQCSPAGAHSQAPATHANEQQSAFVVQVALERPQFAAGCHELQSQLGIASAAAMTSSANSRRCVIETGTRR
jgi:hypothetical protein